MSRFLLNEEEKDNIRIMYESYGIFLNEDNVFGSIARKAVAWAGKNEDDIIKLFKTTEVALAKSIDDIISVASRSKNLTQLDDLQAKLIHFYNPSGQASGVAAAKQNTVKFLNGYSKSKGKPNWKVIRDEVSGTPQDFNKTVPMENPKSQDFNKTAPRENPGSVNKLPLGEIGKNFKEMASQVGGWLQVKNPVGNMSGWKFHIYADYLDEAAFLYEKLLPVVNKYGAGMKVASSEMLYRLAQNAVQSGKGVTIYLPSNVVAKNAQKQFLNDVQTAINGYKKTGKISGDNMITDNIGYRYELSKPIDPNRGVNMDEYQALYKSNDGGSYNIDRNPDLFR
jgi:hypothetical protein